MPSPFPGMDPYIERPELWPDFHDSLIAAIRGILQPYLRPRYAALTQDRLYVMESDRPIYPDVGIVRTNRPAIASGHGAAATLECDSPAVFDLPQEEIREPYIEIIEPAAGNRIVTALEVLSPTNKTAGAGRNSYVKKREELWGAGVNLVEIDLLREGDPTVRVSQPRLESLRPWHYLVAVARQHGLKQEVYPTPLRQRLPRVSIPLAPEDLDVPLDLQAAFTRCWDEGPYPELLHYGSPPPGPMAPEDALWCEGSATRP
jgi:Protein of unknown function (DUF4058)